MKKIKNVIFMFLTILILFQLTSCRSENEEVFIDDTLAWKTAYEYLKGKYDKEFQCSNITHPYNSLGKENQYFYAEIRTKDDDQCYHIAVQKSNDDFYYVDSEDYMETVVKPYAEIWIKNIFEEYNFENLSDYIVLITRVKGSANLSSYEADYPYPASYDIFCNSLSEFYHSWKVKIIISQSSNFEDSIKEELSIFSDKYENEMNSYFSFQVDVYSNDDFASIKNRYLETNEIICNGEKRLDFFLN